MNKKIITFFVISIFVFNITGCKNDEFLDQNQNEKREILELEDYRNNPVSLNFEEDDDLNIKNINFDSIDLEERTQSFYDNEKELDFFVNYIKKTLNVEINNNWKVMIHYYNSQKTDGMIEFMYSIGEINTNRSIIFGLENGKYNTLYYKCLDGNINEEDLINRVNLFKNKYVQGKRELQTGETFYEEDVNYIYYVNVDKLVYSYAYFFKYDMGIINNDFGTVRLIDEDGNAVVIK